MQLAELYNWTLVSGWEDELIYNVMCEVTKSSTDKKPSWYWPPVHLWPMSHKALYLLLTGNLLSVLTWFLEVGGISWLERQMKRNGVFWHPLWGYCRTERNGGNNTAKIVDSLQRNCAQWASHFLAQVPPSSIKWSLYLLPFRPQGDVEGTQEQCRVKMLGNSAGY